MMLTLTEAYTHASNHRREIEASSLAGCFHCLAVFPARQIVDWVDGGATGICPRCGMDSVLGDKVLVTVRRGFLERMHARWFSEKRASGALK